MLGSVCVGVFDDGSELGLIVLIGVFVDEFNCGVVVGVVFMFVFVVGVIVLFNVVLVCCVESFVFGVSGCCFVGVVVTFCGIVVLGVVVLFCGDVGIMIWLLGIFWFVGLIGVVFGLSNLICFEFMSFWIEFSWLLIVVVILVWERFFKVLFGWIGGLVKVEVFIIVLIKLREVKILECIRIL